MNVDEILKSLNEEQVDYLLIGGMNFLILHFPELTFDVDVWVWDDSRNLASLNRALKRMRAEWGPTESLWSSIPEDWTWLQQQGVFCLTTAYGALDVFREVRGLEGLYQECKARAIQTRTAAGVPFAGLSDRDMLACQEALPVSARKENRMRILRESIQKGKLERS